MRRIAITVVSLALTAAPLVAAPAGAEDAAAAARPKVVAKNLLSPLSLAVTPAGGVWFSQNFGGTLMRARPGKAARAVYQAPKQGAEVGAVSLRRGKVSFAITGPEGGTRLMVRTRKGRIKKVANLSHHEKAHNPDATTVYGVPGLDAECAEQWPVDDLGPATYPGIVESHPYATFTKGRTTYVADAAANAILGVNRRGVVSTVAVLPAQQITIPAEAAAMGIPECAVGHQYGFEPVPTDVEMGKDGMLYVSTLPGGPEDDSFGLRGAVHRIDPATGDVETVATGLLSATGLAVARNGDIYVAEMFRNRIAVIPAGTSQPTRWRKAGLPGDVEFRKGRVWATRRSVSGLFPGTGDAPKGQIVRY